MKSTIEKSCYIFLRSLEMNSINELLENAQVEWKQLEEVCQIKAGQEITKKEIAKNIGIYPVISSGKEPLGFINTWNTENDPIGITTRGNGVGSITYQEGRYFRGNLNYAVTIHDISKVNCRFLYHVLINEQDEIHKLCTFSGIPALNASSLKKLEIPIPSIEIQVEIVKILDKFTSYIAELQVEYQARIKQYEYYRNLLFSDEYLHKISKNIDKLGNNIGFQEFSLEHIVQLKHGKDWRQLGQGEIPVYGTGGKMNIYVDKYLYNKPSVLIPRKGSIENLFYLEEPFWNVGTIFYTEINEEEILPKYFYYFIENYNLKSLSTDFTRPSLTQDVLKKIKIKLPSKKIQNKVVEILDSFQSLMEDRKGLLPKEIALRQRQYGYYREKLLHFP